MAHRKIRLDLRKKPIISLFNIVGWKLMRRTDAGAHGWCAVDRAVVGEENGEINRDGGKDHVERRGIN